MWAATVLLAVGYSPLRAQTLAGRVLVLRGARFVGLAPPRRTSIISLREPADPDVLKVQLAALSRALAPARRDERPGNPAIVEPEILDVIRILESINPTERPAASPLLDGVWAPIWARNVPPAWARSLAYFPGRAHFSIQFDLSDPVKPGLYRQRMRIAGLLCADVDGRCSALGGTHLSTEFQSDVRVKLLGVPLFRRGLDPLSSDLDHDLRATFLDGTMLILRAAEILVGARVLRPARIYVLERQRSEFWQPRPEDEPKQPSWLPEA